MAGNERSRSPFDMNSFYPGKSEVTLFDGINKDCLDMAVLLLSDPIHRRVKDELSAIDHENVIGYLLHFGYLM